MTENARGVLEIGTNGQGEVVINHPDLKPDENGVGHIVFSVEQAHNLAKLLSHKAHEAHEEMRSIHESERIKNVPPVDRNARVLVSGKPVSDDYSHTAIQESGQQKDYVVLTADERSKGFVRPYRDAYRHLKCGHITTMSRAIAETYARDPTFYTGTFCTTCRNHFPIGDKGEFVWFEMDGTTGPKVGT